MKSPRLLLIGSPVLAAAVAALYFAGCQPQGSAPAASASPTVSAPAVPADGMSPTAAAVSKHLEFGGEFYVVVDAKGDLQNFGDKFADFLSAVVKSSPEVPPRIAELDFRELFKRAGFYSLEGGGLSSWKDKDGVFHHNRVFLYTPNGREGFLKAYGGAPGPFVSPTLAPADADLVVEATFDAKAVADLILSYVRDVGGPPAAASVDKNLQMPAPGTANLTVQDIIGKLNTRGIVVARADTKHMLPLPNGNQMPMIDLLISLDGFSDVLDQFDEMLKDNPMATVEMKNGMKTVSVDLPLPPPFDVYKPMLIADPKTKRLYVVTRSEFADQTVFGQGPRLNTSEDFKASIAGLPTEGNSLTYISKNAMLAYVDFASHNMNGMPAAAREKLNELSLAPFRSANHGQASTSVNLPDGILGQSNALQSTKTVLLAAPVVAVGLVAAMAIPAFEKVRAQSQQKAVTANLRQIASAAQMYMLEKGVTQVNYSQLVGTGPNAYLRPVTPVMGEHYDDLVIKNSDTSISVTTPDGRTITFEM